MVPGLIGGGNLGTCGKSAQRKSVGNTLGSDQDVGLDSVMLDGKHFSCAAESGLHFVGDKQDSMLVKNLLDLAKIVLRRNQNAAFAHDWFRDECGHVPSGRKTNHLSNRLRTLAAAFLRIMRPQRTIRMGRGRE